MNKLTQLLAMLLLVATSINVSAQSQTETLLRDVKEYNDSFLKKDFAKHVDYTVPYVTEVAGGKDVMIENIKATYEMTTAGGAKYVSIEPLEPGEIKLAGKELHSILPQRVINQYGDTKFGKTGYFLAISQNEGKSWTFLDLEPYDAESIKTFVRSFTGELEIPEVEMPEVIEE